MLYVFYYKIVTLHWEEGTQKFTTYQKESVNGTGKTRIDDHNVGIAYDF
jgi:hypothetical protein